MDDVEIDYRLSVLKSLHAKWLISLYDYMSSPEGKAVVSDAWKKSGIYDAITMGSNKFPVLDPFSEICPPLKGTLMQI